MSDTRLQELEARTYHIDGRVGAIESQLTQVMGAVGRIEQHIISDKPEAPNVVGWATLAFSILVGAVGMVFSMNTYFSSQMDPIRARLDVYESKTETLYDFRHQMHYEVGRFHEELKSNDLFHAKVEQKFNSIDERERVLSEEAAANKVSRKAMGDYIRQIDELGSRRWMNEEPKRASEVEHVR